MYARDLDHYGLRTVRILSQPPREGLAEGLWLSLEGARGQSQRLFWTTEPPQLGKQGAAHVVQPGIFFFVRELQYGKQEFEPGVGEPFIAKQPARAKCARGRTDTGIQPFFASLRWRGKQVGRGFLHAIHLIRRQQRIDARRLKFRA
jgi:hypothetical protein